MGDLCQEGILVDKNEARAFAFYSKAAAAGHDHYSEYQLGCAWYDGIGTAMDREKGLSLLKKAWKDGSSDAAYRLALIAENGIGILRMNRKPPCGTSGPPKWGNHPGQRRP